MGPTRVRWVGFDMDECLGSFMSLWSYADPLLERVSADERRHILTRLARRLNDVGSLWLFRPHFDEVLRALGVAQREGRITGCFILSNNGSAPLVELVRLILNDRVARVLHIVGPEPLFKVGWHRTAPCRGRSMVKSWAVIQRCLAAGEFPTMSARTDLLFYDDLEHQLAHEIPHYVRVPPYYNYTPHALVFKEIQAVLRGEGLASESIREAYTTASRNEEEDVRNDRDIQVRPPSAAAERDALAVFMGGLAKFLGPISRRRHGTQKRAQRRRRATATRGSKLIQYKA